MAPLVSVLMTAYNRQNYIRPAIESVLNQSFTDFELIIVDDCSMDATVEVAREYEADCRVRVVRNSRNLGDYPNRNRAATFARGAFLKYHDSDDIMYPHCLATMVQPLLTEPRAGFALTARHAWAGGPCPMLLSPRMAYQREFLGAGLLDGGPSSAVFRAEVFRDLGGFPEIGAGSDNLFFLVAAAQTSLLLVQADLFWYREHAGQEKQSIQAQLDYAIVPGSVWQLLKSPLCPLLASERDEALRNWMVHLIRLIRHDLVHGRLHIALLRLQRAPLSTVDWLRYARPPRHVRLAGTPLDQDGEFVIPGVPSARSATAEGSF